MKATVENFWYDRKPDYIMLTKSMIHDGRINLLDRTRCHAIVKHALQKEAKSNRV